MRVAGYDTLSIGPDDQYGVREACAKCRAVAERSLSVVTPTGEATRREASAGMLLSSTHLNRIEVSKNLDRKCGIHGGTIAQLRISVAAETVYLFRSGRDEAGVQCTSINCAYRANGSCNVHCHVLTEQRPISELPFVVQSPALGVAGFYHHTGVLLSDGECDSTGKCETGVCVFNGHRYRATNDHFAEAELPVAIFSPTFNPTVCE
jgi:hypothetical protein